MSWFLSALSVVCGITYFIAWSASFYPQVYLNWKRKSVVGFSFDYLNYNMLGFTCYTIYNCGLFFGPMIQREYEDKFGTSQPIQPSDVLFTCHALLLCSIQCSQCFIYDRGNQYISIVAAVLAICGWLSAWIYGFLAATSVTSWLSFVYFLSYIKLAVTLVKYIPQAYMNFKNKSTVGWHIGNVLLDLTGGIFSFLQMFVDALNEGDWSAFTNVSKLGLSIFSIAFDLLFIVQHYICYPPSKRKPEKKKRAAGEESSDETDSDEEAATFVEQKSVNKYKDDV